MKKVFIIFFFVFFAEITHSNFFITIGPNVGEIYFSGPTYSSYGLYYSTDFGNTAICVDNSYVWFDNYSIAADKTEGVIYYGSVLGAFARSDNYGYAGTWTILHGNINWPINSGMVEGKVFCAFTHHSDDYGVTMIPHLANGFFGNFRMAVLDNKPNIGYILVDKYNVSDSLYLLISYDNFENLQLYKQLNYKQNEGFVFCRGTAEGEHFIYDTDAKLFHSTDFMQTWNLVNQFNDLHVFPIEYFDISGGRQDGECYLYVDYNGGTTGTFIYILHSIDYGKTFELYKPFHVGESPVIANFSTDTLEGELPFTVDFCNYSFGNDLQYQWDFNNDGIYDSFEEEPTWTFSDTGHYSVRLNAYNNNYSNIFIKENYIHVTNIVGMQDHHIDFPISCYPNPFQGSMTIELGQAGSYVKEIKIFDANGKCINSLPVINGTTTWNGLRSDGSKAGAGCYYLLIASEKPVINKIIRTE